MYRGHIIIDETSFDLQPHTYLTKSRILLMTKMNFDIYRIIFDRLADVLAYFLFGIGFNPVRPPPLPPPPLVFLSFTQNISRQPIPENSLPCKKKFADAPMKKI